MEEDEKHEYARLLLEEDQDLFQWLVKKMPIPDESLQEMVDFILKQHSQINSN